MPLKHVTGQSVSQPVNGHSSCLNHLTQEDGCEYSGKRPGKSIIVVMIFSFLLPAAQYWCEDRTAFFVLSSHPLGFIWVPTVSD